MGSQVSLRGLLAQAANFIAQLPSSLTSVSSSSSSLSAVPGDDHRYYAPLSGAPSCPIDGPVSCHNDTPVAGDSCCYIYPSGRLLLAQFWDREVHVGGSEEDWTLHGLW